MNISPRPSFSVQLSAAWQSSNSLLCVGLDPDATRLPPMFAHARFALFDFCRAIVDATAPLVCAFKPQMAYFSAQCAEDQLEQLIAYIHDTYPTIPVILDAKRGDIGATARQYAREAFERYEADALTVNPYMGYDSIEPYLQWAGKGVIALCRTSNPGGGDLQSLSVNGQPLYQHVAQLAARSWNASGQLSLVVGATYPDEIAQVRRLVGEMPLLIPGIGAQGGDVEATVKAGITTQGTGMMISSSRAILYASAGEDFAHAAAVVAARTRDEINRWRGAGGE